MKLLYYILIYFGLLLKVDAQTTGADKSPAEIPPKVMLLSERGRVIAHIQQDNAHILSVTVMAEVPKWQKALEEDKAKLQVVNDELTKYYGVAPTQPPTQGTPPPRHLNADQLALLSQLDYWVTEEANRQIQFNTAAANNDLHIERPPFNDGIGTQVSQAQLSIKQADSQRRIIEDKLGILKTSANPVPYSFLRPLQDREGIIRGIIYQQFAIADSYKQASVVDPKYPQKAEFAKRDIPRLETSLARMKESLRFNNEQLGVLPSSLVPK